ncbi:hypothetical protein [Polaromonas sp.]|uniref:hypothetical protein n=1 Tax=Polaromonas sp. TaxID=1869339 RepID=UPI0013BD4A02|nr:hypothetical protein [Polaromonas sp.]NDP63518.1 hypothetical protein [Polaromonas sp.]
MSKVKTLLGENTSYTTQADAQPSTSVPQASNSFLQTLAQIAEPFLKPVMSTDPVERMRAKFATNADEVIQSLTEGMDKGKWFKKLTDGKFLVSFRNANNAMPFNGTTHFQVSDAATVIKLVNSAKIAVAQGELDTVLKATQRKFTRKDSEVKS